MAASGQPLKWEGRLEEAFEAEVERQGGLQAARPKQVLDALQPQFPSLQLRVESVKWHLQAHRRRVQREAELADRQDGPIRWTGALKKAFERVVQQAGGLAQARPKAVWEALAGEWPQLTVPSCKWHIQTLRKKEAARGGGGGGGSSARAGSSGDEDEDEEGGGDDEDASGEEEEEEGEEGSDRSGARQPAARASAQPSSDGACKSSSSLRPPRSAGKQAAGKRASMDEQPGSQEPKKRPGSSGSPAAAAAEAPPLWGSQRGMFGASTEQVPWRAAAAAQQQQRRQPQWPQPLPWEPYTLAAAEEKLALARTKAAQARQLLALLQLRAARQVDVLEALQAAAGAGAGSPAERLAALRHLTPQQAAQLIASALPASEPGGAMALGALAPLLQPAAAAAAAASVPRHSAATCTVPGCRRCAYEAKLDKAEAEALAEAQRQAQEVQLHELALQMERVASLESHGVQMLDAEMLGTLLDHLPLPSPLDQPPSPLQQLLSPLQQPLSPLEQPPPLPPPPQGAVSSSRPFAVAAAVTAASSSNPLGRAGSGPAVQQPPSLEVQELHAAHLALDLAGEPCCVCAAICAAVAHSAGRHSVAAFLGSAGARSPEDVTGLLASTAFVGVAHEATRAAGVTLAEWAALLAACRRHP